MANIGPGGYMQPLPVQIQRDTVVESTMARVLPWQMPGLLALSGRDSLGSDNRILAICYEWPLSWLRTAQDIGQFELEWFHLHRFRTDHIFGTGVAPFIDVIKGSNPPDAIVTTDYGPVNVECTGLIIGARRDAHGLFRNIRQTIQSQSPAVFSSLSGHMVYMWFNESDSVLTRPYRRNDSVAAKELVEALAAYRPQPENLWIPAGSGPPQQFPDLKMHKTEAGASFYCTPIVAVAPSTVLFSMAGFEVGFAYTTTHESEEEWAALSRRVASKDRPNSEWLIISAGAPDQKGNLHPAEEALAEFLISNPKKIDPVKHLKRVTIHSWGTGRAVDIWPEFKPVFGPLYEETVPTNQPLWKGTDQPTAEGQSPE